VNSGANFGNDFSGGIGNDIGNIRSKYGNSFGSVGSFGSGYGTGFSDSGYGTAGGLGINAGNTGTAYGTGYSNSGFGINYAGGVRNNAGNIGTGYGSGTRFGSSFGGYGSGVVRCLSACQQSPGCLGVDYDKYSRSPCYVHYFDTECTTPPRTRKGTTHYRLRADSCKYTPITLITPTTPSTWILFSNNSVYVNRQQFYFKLCFIK
jgi:hypothetical protein